VDQYLAHFASDPKLIVHARRAVRGFVQSCGFSPEDVGDVVVAVGEAIDNAVEHASATKVRIECRFDEGSLLVEVCDDGLGFPDWNKVPLAGERQPLSDGGVRVRGYGIHLMRELMDDLSFKDDGRCVCLTKQLSRAGVS
jgi:serine/threonine-protein kinase RsbW